MPLRPWLIAAVLGASAADAGPFKKKDKDDDVVVVEVAPQPVAQPSLTGVFPAVLDGWAPGSLPQGLPSLSAQSCNACHYQAHDTWASSAHGSGGSTAWRDAAAESGNPACAACHLPLGVQRPKTFAFDSGDVNKVVVADNEAFDATLHIEGVTCAACHVREGAIVAARPVAEPPAVHPGLTWSEELTSPAGCASCHQLSWPDADTPLYDTYGEWERSGYAQAGVTCATCHLGPGAAEGPVSHHLQADPGRALTIEIAVGEPRLVRGDQPFQATVALTNTGAGHAVPTGSPWRALQVELLLEGSGEEGPIAVGQQASRLERTLSEGAPWTTTDDTRLTVGERRELSFSSPLDTEQPSEGWAFVVRIREVARGEPGEVVVERRLPLVVE